MAILSSPLTYYSERNNCALRSNDKGLELAHFVNCIHNNIKSAAGQSVIVLKKMPGPGIIPPLAYCCGTLLIQGALCYLWGWGGGALSIVPPVPPEGGHSGDLGGVGVGVARGLAGKMRSLGAGRAEKEKLERTEHPPLYTHTRAGALTHTHTHFLFLSPQTLTRSLTHSRAQTEGKLRLSLVRRLLSLSQ